MIVKTKINMDLDRSGPVRRMEAVQGDTNTRVLELALHVNGIPWQVPENVTAQVRYGQDNGIGGVYDTLPDGRPAWAVSGNLVSVVLAPQLLAQAGDMDLQVELIRGSHSLATFTVCLHVQKNPALGAADSRSYINMRQWLQEQLEELLGTHQLPGGSVTEIRVGSVTTLTPGQSAYASITQTEDKAVLNLGIPAGYSPAKGVDYWTEAEKQEMTDLLRGELAESVADAVLDLAQIGPEFAESTDQCVDTGKLYVLPDGYLYAYMERETYIEPTELYDPAAATLDKRHSGSPGSLVAGSGYVMTDYIPVDMTAAEPVLLKITTDGFNASISTTKPSFQKIGYYDVDKACIGSRYIHATAQSGNGIKLEYSGNETTVYLGYTNTDAKETFYDQIAYVRIEVAGTNSSATEADRGLIVSIIDPNSGGTCVERGWLNTGHAYVPADYEDRILTLEETVQSHARKLAGNQYSSVSVPKYWEDYLLEKAETIRALQTAGGRDCFSFAALADIHESSNLGKYSGALARRLLDSCDIKYALVLGDTAMRGSAETESELLSSFDRAEEILSPIRDRALQLRGNHDGSWGDDGSTYYIRDLSPEKIHSLIWRKAGMVSGAAFDDTGSAYYVDDPANRVRYILLNSHWLPYQENGDGTPKYSTFRNARFGQAQFDWLIRDALRVAQGWAIIIGTHVPLSDDYAEYFGGSAGESVLLRELLAAYNSREIFRETFGGTLGVDAVEVEVDFYDAVGEVIAVVAGHSHTDTAALCGVTVITTRCDAAEENTEELKAQRVKGTVTEQSFDIFTVNRKTRTITATKIGAGEDRVIPY